MRSPTHKQREKEGRRGGGGGEGVAQELVGEREQFSEADSDLRVTGAILLRPVAGILCDGGACLRGRLQIGLEEEFLHRRERRSKVLPLRVTEQSEQQLESSQEDQGILLLLGNNLHDQMMKEIRSESRRHLLVREGIPHEPLAEMEIVMEEDQVEEILVEHQRGQANQLIRRGLKEVDVIQIE